MVEASGVEPAVRAYKARSQRPSRTASICHSSTSVYLMVLILSRKKAERTQQHYTAGSPFVSPAGQQGIVSGATSTSAFDSEQVYLIVLALSRKIPSFCQGIP